jgi:hypothetical protein
MKTFLLSGALLLLATSLSFSQQMTQTVRGQILDQDAKSPLIGATVQVVGTDPILGAVTDLDGNFRITNVPVGRASLFVTYIGYEDRVIPNIQVNSAKEVLLNIDLVESIDKLDEVVVTAKKDKSEVLNEMALVSARSFSVEETQRYAGAINDPARMVSAFAGVNGDAQGNNDIVVRGNSSKGILWKLEGVEIPNPNHFANEGATGGPVNALNSNMLDNSDFFTGAFSPEYGNALSGVFDIKFKKGNNEQREYTTSLGVFGVDFTAEGPFKQGYNGSYIANYRYSSLQLLSDAGILDFNGVPKYQDGSFNIALPIGKKHYMTMFGLGGISNISQTETDEENEDIVLSRGDFGARLGVVGVNHTYFINDNVFVRNSVALSLSGQTSNYDMNEDTGFRDVEDIDLNKNSIRVASTLNYKLNAKNKFETGIIYSRLGYNAKVDLYNYENKAMDTWLDDKGNTGTLQAFGSWKLRFNEAWTMTSGVHYFLFALNNTQSVEPRVGLKYDLNSKQAFTAGFGLHSRLEPVSAYLAKQTQEDGSLLQPNKNLRTTKAAHYVVGFNQVLNQSTHLKLEAYYQQLYDVPVEKDPSSSFSMINSSGAFVNESLVNEGTGRNYGVELTLEQYLNRGFYYMSTVSLYKSLYTAQDGVERASAFDGNYIVNVIGGKEFKVGSTNKNRVLFVNAKAALIGGQRYSPIDLEASRELGTEVRDDANPFSVKGDDVFFVNLAIGTRKNRKKTTSEFKIDVTNVTNNQALVNEYYVAGTGNIVKSYQLAMLPNIVYTLKF